jgi:glycosyltransferase involved in cell wall biosynthesis
MRSHLLRQRLGLGSTQRIVLYHGSLMAGRALPQLLRAAAHFDPETTLVMIGEQNDYYTDVLRPVQMSERLEKRVVFVPFVEPEEVLQYVASADLGVVIYENVNLNNYLCAPTKLYEFLMASVPVVVSAFPELLHFLREFPVGASFDPSDPESIASAVNATLRASPAERGLRAAAVQEARQIFTWERESAKLLHVFGGAA